ncbi:Uncharacterised protein [Starkeya nomas]|uniref:Uncharacterized protein n=1 Tax=Starkeya nomas TaxID=2666134 RepID=A0A5S9NC25_9HYPH|nr:hypothetical protein [Starkeya nomas]CAA0086986.1 Uncharacterised protein [Starkeya nomas]
MVTQYWMWELVTEEKAELLAALARLAAAESWTYEEFSRSAAQYFAAPENADAEGAS